MSTLSLRGALTALAVGAGLTLSVASAQAATAVFNFDTPTGNLGNTHTYTVNGVSITAAGFAFDFPFPTALFGKDAGAGEQGLGIAADPTGCPSACENEISGTNFIRIAMPAGVTAVSFIMNSVTNGEAWDVFGSNSATTGYSILLGPNFDQGISHSLPVENFYLFEAIAGTGNVLLNSMTVSTVPEPATWAMMLLGFLGLGFAFRQSRRKVSFA